MQEGWRPLWVVDFPMFEWDAEAKRWVAMHHPFTSPKNDDPAALRADPGQRAGQGLRHGAERLGDRRRLGAYSPRRRCSRRCSSCWASAPRKRRRNSASCWMRCKFGAPPHGGIAFGLDRLAMLMAGADSIREVIAFPKTQTAADPMTDAPTEVSEEQLRELHIRRAHAAGRTEVSATPSPPRARVKIIRCATRAGIVCTSSRARRRRVNSVFPLVRRPTSCPGSFSGVVPCAWPYRCPPASAASDVWSRSTSTASWLVPVVLSLTATNTRLET